MLTEAQQHPGFAYVDGCSHGETAQRLNAPLGSVKAWVRRGLLARVHGMNADDLHVSPANTCSARFGRTPRRGGARVYNDARTTAVEQWQQKLLPLNALAKRAGGAVARMWSRIETSVAAQVAADKGVRPVEAPTAAASSWWNSLRLWRPRGDRFRGGGLHGHRGGRQAGAATGTGLRWWSWSGRRTSPRLGGAGRNELATGAADSARQGGRACRRRCSSGPRATTGKAPSRWVWCARRIERSVARQTAAAARTQSTFEITLEPYNGSPLDRPPARSFSSGGGEDYLSVARAGVPVCTWALPALLATARGGWCTTSGEGP